VAGLLQAPAIQTSSKPRLCEQKQLGNRKQRTDGAWRVKTSITII